MTEREPPKTEGMPSWSGWTLPNSNPRGGAENPSSRSGDSGDGELSEHRCLELCPICRTADALRAAGPPELRGQLDGVGREALLTLRALIDRYLERLDEQPTAADRVEDIPID